MLDIAGDILNITYGIAQAFGAKGVESAKKGLYKTQLEGSKKRAEWNEKEILKAFTENYSNTAYTYGQKIADIIGQQAQAQSELNTSVVSTISNADMSESSFYNTAKLEADKEFSESVQTMLANQSQSLLGLAKERDTQIMQNQTELGQAMYKNQMQNLQAKQEREQTYVNAMTSVATSGAGIMGSDTFKKWTGSDANDIKSSISATGSNAGGWSSALKGSQGSRLSLTNF